MHNTVAVLKNGKKVEGVLWTFRPEDDYFTLVVGGKDRKIKFSACSSVVTEGERLARGKIGVMDELERARQYLSQGREHGWFKNAVPVMAWETEGVKA